MKVRYILLLIFVYLLFLIVSNRLVVNQLKIKISKKKIEFDIDCIEEHLAYEFERLFIATDHCPFLWTEDEYIRLRYLIATDAADFYTFHKHPNFS